jgi:serine/threonine protein kinase/tetratricopeptide (TPR) repeat protein
MLGVVAGSRSGTASKRSAPKPSFVLSERGPMPLALIARRARNAKTGAAVLQNATHYLGEAGACFAAAYWLARALAQGVEPNAALRTQLDGALGRGASFGAWVGLWREAAAAVSGDALATLSRPLDDVAPLEALAAALAEEKDALGEDGAALVSALKQARGRGVLGFFELLVTFRNRIYGHGTMLPESSCRRLALPFLDATCHVLRQRAFVEGAWLGRVAIDALSDEPRRYWRRLEGVAETPVDAEDLPPDAALSPRCLYAVRGEQALSLSFWVVQDEDATGLSRFGFFQRAVSGRKPGARPKAIEYLDYLGGRFRDETMLGELAEALPRLSSAGPRAAPEEPASSRGERQLGDFLIESELGRGAMGIVYRAEQLSLGRKVALKVLPPALLEDPIALGRFNREVQALGRCDHPNVVRVLASGIEEGRPWFAMELVDGADLAVVWSTLDRWKGEGALGAAHLPAAASSGGGRRARAAAAQSVADADDPVAVPPPDAPAIDAGGDLHERLARLFADAADGIEEIHRRGLIHRDIKPANLMLTADGERLVVMDLGLAKAIDGSVSYTTAGGGDFVGSARYAAPEQLQARLVSVDHRADVYALGATLYELATQSTLYPADDLAQLLAEKLQREPHSAREVDPRVPRDLDTILQKAMARRPEDRYGSAADLASDLRAFAAHRPIRARAPSAFEYLRLFYRRERRLVAAGAAAAALLVLVVAGGFVLIARERAEAVAQRDRAVAAQAEAQSEREAAEKLAAFIADDLYSRLKPMGKLDIMRGVTDRLVEHYATRPVSDRLGSIRYADALVRSAKVREAVGELAEAHGRYDLALERLEAVLPQHPDDAAVLATLAKVHDALSRVWRQQNQLEQAFATNQRALEIRLRLAAADPTDRNRRFDLAMSHKGHAIVLEMRGRRGDAFDVYEKGLAICEELARERPDDAEAQSEIASFHSNLGEILEAHGKRDEALAAYRRALDVSRTLAERDPGNAVAQRHTAASHDNIGDMTKAQSPELALAEYEAAFALRQRLGRLDPSNIEWQRDLSVSYHKLAGMHFAAGKLELALETFRNDLALVQALSERDPTDTMRQHDVSVAHVNVARVLRAREERAAALAEYEKALAIRRRLATQAPTNTEWQRSVAVACSQLGTLHLENKQDGPALDSFREAVAIGEKLIATDPSNLVWKRDLAASRALAAKILARRGEHDAALAELGAAEALQAELVKATPGNLDWQRELAATHQARAGSLRALGRARDAKQELERALAMFEQALDQSPGDTRTAKLKADVQRALHEVELGPSEDRRSNASKTRGYSDLEF